MGDILSIKLLEQFIFEDIDSDNARETARAKTAETLGWASTASVTRCCHKSSYFYPKVDQRVATAVFT